MNLEDQQKSFRLDEAVEILTTTPAVLDTLLGDLSATWISFHEADDSWSSFDILGHLVHGEETDWIPRARLILESGEKGGRRSFEPFDRFAQFERFGTWSLARLLDRFGSLRRENLSTLEEWNLSSTELGLTGRHPELGDVTLEQLLAAWVVHDLSHIGQVARTLARRLTLDVGAWQQYLPILNRPS